MLRGVAGEVAGEVVGPKSWLLAGGVVGEVVELKSGSLAPLSIPLICPHLLARG